MSFVFWLSPSCEHFNMINDLNMQHLSNDHMPTYSCDFFHVLTTFVNELSETVRNGQNRSLVSGTL